MARQPDIIERGEVTTTLDGKDYVGSYQVQGPRAQAFVSVRYKSTTKETQLGNADTQMLVEMLLHEAVAEHLATHPDDT